jgi:hypothetical protein
MIVVSEEEYHTLNIDTYCPFCTGMMISALHAQQYTCFSGRLSSCEVVTFSLGAAMARRTIASTTQETRK